MVSRKKLQPRYNQLFVDKIAIEAKELRLDFERIKEVATSLQQLQHDKYESKLKEYLKLEERLWLDYMMEQSPISKAELVEYDFKHLFAFQYRQELTTSKKLKIIRKLINLACELKYNDNPILERQLSRLELQLESGFYEGGFDIYDLYHDSDHWSAVSSSEGLNQYVAELEKVLKNNQRIVARHFRRIYQYIRFDLRRRFRSIINILFKNMDDESGDNHKLLHAFGKQFFITSNFFINEEQRYYFSFAVNRQDRAAFSTQC